MEQKAITLPQDSLSNNQDSLSNKQDRQANFELLRIISMIMILVLHLNYFGGLISGVGTHVFSGSYIFVWVTESLSVAAVNIYVLISGYFLINSKFDWKKIIRLWGQLFFYSTFIYLVLVLVKQEPFRIETFSRMIMPVSFDQYWFVTLYIMLLILSPLLNLVIRSLSKSQFKLYLIVFLLAFSVLPVKNALFIQGGESLLWFVYLYFVAAYVRIYYQPDFKWLKFLVGFLVFAGVSFSMVLFVTAVRINQGVEMKSIMYFPEYNSLFVFLASICLFLAAVNSKITNAKAVKVILWFSPLTLGVYLIHMHPQFYLILWDKVLQPVKYLDSPLLLLIYPAMIMGIFICFSLLEYARRKIFYRIEYGAWMGMTYQLFVKLYGRLKIKEFMDRW